MKLDTGGGGWFAIAPVEIAIIEHYSYIDHAGNRKELALMQASRCGSSVKDPTCHRLRTYEEHANALSQ